jgi:chlorite dismutase
MSQAPAASQEQEPLNIDEIGAPKDGAPQRAQTRLYVQLRVFTQCLHPSALIEPLRACGADAVLYLDAHDARGVGVLFMSETPDFFTEGLRSLLTRGPFGELTPQPALTMMGRTYSSGREANLMDWLLRKPRRMALDPQWPWAVWYPMRRKASFERLPREEQGKIMFEHARIGMGFGDAGLVRDIRLACHGLDRNDNDFVLGLVGRDLYPLSRIVQEMRKTQQTALHMESLGPFFVGKAAWQSPFQEG